MNFCFGILSCFFFFYKAALGDSLPSISTMIGKRNTIDLILPVFSILLKDQDSEVRINLLKKLGDFAKVKIFFILFQNFKFFKGLIKFRKR